MSAFEVLERPGGDRWVFGRCRVVGRFPAGPAGDVCCAGASRKRMSVSSCRVWFGCWLPLLLIRWRIVSLEEAGIGETLAQGCLVWCV